VKTRKYNSFWKKIHSSARKKGFPLRAMFELTYRCNFHCPHCYIPPRYSEYGELSTKDVFSIIDQLSEIGCFYLGFTGGEPFIRGDAMDIFWYAKKKGFEIIIYTNGSLINEAIAKELQQLRPNKVDITLTSMKKKSFEKISKVPGSYEKVFSTIEMLRENKIPVGFKTCILKENEDEIEEMQEFTSSLGASHRLDNMLSRRLNGSVEPFKYRGILEQRKKNYFFINTNFFKRIIEQIKNCEFTKKRNIDLFGCGVGRTQVAITPLGELKMCLMIDYPKINILQTSLKESWRELKKIVDDIQPDESYKCNNCELEKFCKWCPARSWLSNKTFTSCEIESRNWAQKRYDYKRKRLRF